MLAGRSCLAIFVAFLSSTWFVACAGTAPAAKESGQAPATSQSLHVSSPAFADGAAIPVEYTCDGADVSPPLSWDGVPADARSIALIMDDPDAPCGTFTHWILYNLPAEQRQLPRDVPDTDRLDNGALQGKNSAGSTGYRGPCPPRGPAHRYQFDVFALNGAVGLEARASKEELIKGIEGKVLGQGRLTGTYQRR